MKLWLIPDPSQGVSARRFTGVRLLLIAITCLGVASCVSHAGWVYHPNPAAPASVSMPLTLAVTDFHDQRPEENSTHFFLCMIPAMLYCDAHYHRPDAANDFHSASAYNFRPSEDFAKAAASELRQTGLFREVYVTDRSSPPDAQLVLRGTILSTDWEGTRYTYGLGGNGQALWLLGLPIGSINDKLHVRLEMVENATGKVLWHYDVNSDYHRTEGLYYNFGTDFGYPEMFRDGMKGALASLEQYVTTQPPGFWNHLRSPE